MYRLCRTCIYLLSFLLLYIAISTWKVVSELLDIDVGSDFESVARFWLAHKRHVLTIDECHFFSYTMVDMEITELNLLSGVRWTGLSMLFRLSE
jgi:hypothetical protein